MSEPIQEVTSYRVTRCPHCGKPMRTELVIPVHPVEWVEVKP